MKAVALLAVLFALTHATRLYNDEPSSTNALLQGVSDQMLGWTDPDETDACKQKFNSLVPTYVAALQSITSFDFNTVKGAFGTLYSSYVSFPQCSFTTNTVSSLSYSVVVTQFVGYLAKLGYTASQISFYVLLVFTPYDFFLKGVEFWMQAYYMVTSAYALVSTPNLVSTQAKGSILGWCLRGLITQLLIRF